MWRLRQIPVRLCYFKDDLSVRLAALAEFLRFSCLAEIHGFAEARFKYTLLDEPCEFCQICCLTRHDHLDGANPGPFRSRFIDRLNRRREHSPLLHNSI